MFATIRRLKPTAAYENFLKSVKVDLKQAMLAKNNVEKTTIRLVLAAVKNKEIDGAKQTEFELSRLLNKMVKQRTESKALYLSQGREDLAKVEDTEALFIAKYVAALPVASESELRLKVTEWLAELHKKDLALQMRDVFKQMTPELAELWKTSPAAVKALVPELYKQFWKPN